MVRFIRSAQTKIGVFPQAVAFAREIAAYVKEEYEADIRIFTDTKGLIFWISDYQSHSHMEEVRGGILGDDGYWKIVGKAKDLFEEGSLEDRVISEINSDQD